MDIFNIFTPFVNTHPFGGEAMGFGGAGLFGALFGLMFTLIFWVLVIAGIFYLVKYLASRDKEDEIENLKDKKDTSRKAMEILKERYAKGEIDKKEFDQKKKDLQD
jgi:putative membrane protein